MKLRILYLGSILLLLIDSVFAQSNRCVGPDGKITLQQAPCPMIQLAPNKKSDEPTATPSLAELVTQCSKLNKESTEYYICSAKLSCRENGAVGTSFLDCVDKLTEGRRRADQATVDRAASARAKTNQFPKASSEIVECIDLYRFARAKGHSYMEAVMIANESEKRGSCRKLE